MYGGLANWIAYLMALVKEIAAPLFTPDSGGFEWEQTGSIWHLTSANLPQLSSAGEELVNLLVTIFQNLLTDWAGASAQLPTNLLQP